MSGGRYRGRAAQGPAVASGPDALAALGWGGDDELAPSPQFKLAERRAWSAILWELAEQEYEQRRNGR